MGVYSREEQKNDLQKLLNSDKSITSITGKITTDAEKLRARGGQPTAADSKNWRVTIRVGDLTMDITADKPPGKELNYEIYPFLISNIKSSNKAINVEDLCDSIYSDSDVPSWRTRNPNILVAFKIEDLKSLLSTLREKSEQQIAEAKASQASSETKESKKDVETPVTSTLTAFDRSKQQEMKIEPSPKIVPIRKDEDKPDYKPR